MKRTWNLDSNLFLFIRYFSFSIASLLSIFLNIFFFQALDTGGFWYILFGVSVLLESTKVSTILTRNIFSALYEKTLNVKIKLAKHFFLSMYLLLAMLSIAATAGFSYFVTETVDSSKQIELRNIEDKIEMVDTIRERIESFTDDSDITISEYIPFIRGQERLEDARNILSSTQAEYNAANLRWMSVRGSDDDPNYIRYRDENTATWNALSTARTNVTTRERELTQVQNEFNDRGENVEVRLAELDAEFNMLISALEVSMTSASLELPLVSKARLATRELQQELSLLQDQIVRDKGMQIIFDDLGDFLDKTPKSIKLIILLFVAFLIELTIFQSAPDIKISRRIVYFFRSWIPNSIDINELLSKFDAELERFNYSETELEIETPEPPIVGQLQATFNEPVKLEFEPVVESPPDPDPDPEPPKPKKTRKPRKKKVVEETEPILPSLPQTTQEDLDRLLPSDSPAAQERPHEEIQAELKKWDEEPIENIQAALTEEPSNGVFQQFAEEVKDVIKEPEAKPEIKNAEGEDFDNLMPPTIHAEPVDENSVAEMLNSIDDELEIIYETLQKNHEGNPSVKYRFGRASEAVVRKFCEFIKLCIGPIPGKFNVEPAESYTILNFSRKGVEVFMDRLSNIKINNQSIIYKRDDHYYSNFSAIQIIKAMTEIVNE